MTANSKLCQIIAKFPNGDWQNVLENEHHGINWKSDGPLTIFNYGIEADFYDPVVQEARGIIINTEKCEVVCWPFRKFGKYDEGYADKIDWSTAKIQEKIDGSIMKLWWNEITGEWTWSSNSMIYAEKTHLPDDFSMSFKDAVEKADNYEFLKYDSLDKECTYIFELVGPGNRVVVPYEKYHIYHTGTRSNITGQEFSIYIGIQRPELYGIHQNLESCIDFVSNKFNTSDGGIVDRCDAEGFVVVDKDYHRIKIKSPIYMQIHGLLNNGKPSKRSLVEMLWHNKINVSSLCRDYPNLESVFKWYDYQVAKIKYDGKAICDITMKLSNRFDRKTIALRIKDHYLSPLGFTKLSHPEFTMDEVWGFFGSAKITKWIPEYPRIDYAYMLRDEESI